MVEPQTNRAESFTVVQSMNDHGAVTVRARETHATYHIVEYADSAVRSRLAALPSGAHVRLVLERAGVRGNVWRASDALPDAQTVISAREAPDA